MTTLVGAVVLWVVPIFVAVSMGRAKNRAGAAYGIFLGWLGVLILALLPARTIPAGDEGTCPYCAETIKLAATVCRHCGRDVAPNPEAI